MLKKKTNNTLSQKNIPLNRRVLGFVILLCVSSAANSDDSKDNYSYLDCSLVLNELINKELDVKYQSSYRVDYVKKEVFIYEDRKNTYYNLCASSECTLTEGLISWGKTEKDNSLEVSEYTGINRWTGKYNGWSKYRYDGKLSYDIRLLGNAKVVFPKYGLNPNSNYIIMKI